MGVDTSQLVRIPLLVEMVRSLSAAQDPTAVLAVVTESMRRIYGPRVMITLSVAGLAPGRFRVAHLIGFAGERYVWTEDAWDGIDRLPIQEGGFLAEVVADREPKLFHRLELGHDPVLGDAIRGMASAIAIPMYLDGQPSMWTVLMKREAEGFTPEELEQSVLRVNLVGATMLQAAMAQALRRADQEIQREVDQIADIQRALLPPAMPRIPGLAVATSYATYDRAGGDYYDFFALAKTPHGDADPAGPWAFLIADASGHGPAAAVVAAMLHAVLQSHDWAEHRPARLLEFLNARLFRRRVGNSFVTAFAAVFDPATRVLSYANAGHPPPVLRSSAAGGVGFLDEVGGRPLGIFDEVGTAEAAVEISPGDAFVLYTDGVTDARSPAGEVFGAARVAATLAASAGHPAELVAAVTQALRRHEAGRRPRDDQTIVACVAGAWH